MTDDESFQRLCPAQIEGTANEEERAQLAALLDASEAARGSYVEQMRIHALLAWQHHRAPVLLPEIERKKIVQVPRWRWVAAAAVLVISTFVVWRQVGHDRAGVSFDVVSASDVPFRAGDRVTRREIEMERGRMSFRMTSGALVEVAGPIKVDLLSPMHLRVRRGTLTADISEGVKGFVVDTDEARVVDLGTRFGVTAGAPAGTDVVVFEGKVDVYHASAKITLSEGEAIRMDRKRESQRLRMVPLGADAQTLKNAAKSDLISDVRDNVSAQGFRRYYGLVRGAMGEGTRVYTTGHHRTWHPMPGSSFPAELAGADAICTFDTDRYEKDLQITLQISRPCDLYVMTDARKPAPDWLKAEFSDTGYRLRSGPWIPRDTPSDALERLYKDENSYVPCVVWRKRITAAGAVTLGSPQSGGQKGAPVMYSLAVKAF